MRSQNGFLWFRIYKLANGILLHRQKIMCIEFADIFHEKILQQGGVKAPPPYAINR